MPPSIRTLQVDRLQDFSFGLKALPSAYGGAAMPIDPLSTLKFLRAIEERVSLRSDWFLPFFFGVLGSIVFVMRNVANVRTPSMNLFSISMRIALGGVAGIVIGWFSQAVLPGFQSTNALSVPFAFAFLTGYSIDALVGLLDRLSQGVGTGAQPQKP